MPDLSADLVAWGRRGFERDYLRFLFPVMGACEFPNAPMHGCACNGCTGARLDELTEVSA